MRYYHVRKRRLMLHLRDWIAHDSDGLGEKDRNTSRWLNLRVVSAKSDLITELLK